MQLLSVQLHFMYDSDLTTFQHLAHLIRSFILLIRFVKKLEQGTLIKYTERKIFFPKFKHILQTQ